VAGRDDSAENYQSLYRRYRPQQFSEVRGQDHVVLALRNAVRDGRVAHAYLFSGPRGTGKTSTARILAKALNCANPADGEPCGECDSCRDIARGASLDVHELDAASNNRVDDMRDLVSRAALASPGEWKVYIVDEVHMLSTAASNALLKTLEEPPARVVFVLATTDPQKVLPTIRSRTQHYEFHLLEPDVLSSLLDEIVRDAKLELPPEGVTSAVRRGHGSARDAISALDQVAAAGVVEDDDRFVRQIVTAIAERDTELALASVADALTAGFDAPRLASDLIDGLRGVFLAVVAPGTHAAIAAAPPEDLPQLPAARAVRSLEVLGTAVVDMRESLDARTTLEVALVRLTHPDVDDTTATLLERLDRLERRVQELTDGSSGPRPGGGAAALAASSGASTVATDPPAAAGGPGASSERPARAVPAAPSARAAATDKPALGAFRRAQSAPNTGSGAPEPHLAAIPEASPSPARESAATPAAMPSTGAPPGVAPPTRDDLVTAWADHILAKLRPRARAIYSSGRFTSVEGTEVTFALPNTAHVEHARPLEDEVGAALSSHFGTLLALRLVADEEAPTAPAARSPGGRVAAEAESETEPEPELEEIAPLDPVQVPSSGSSGRHDSVAWAESRLLEEFPGAEEVS